MKLGVVFQARQKLKEPMHTKLQTTSRLHIRAEKKLEAIPCNQLKKARGCSLTSASGKGAGNEEFQVVNGPSMGCM